jgi:two-component system response regulator HydG
MKPKALVVEDDEQTAEAFCNELSKAGFSVRHAPSSELALSRYLREESFHLALCDLMLPGRSGLSLINKLKQVCPATQTVLVTNHGSPSTVATAFKRGACEFLPKPVPMREFNQLCNRIKSNPTLFLPNQLLVEPADYVDFSGMLGRDPAMLAVLQLARDIAPLRHPVLLVGETSVGKRTLAQAMHTRSTANKGPFVVVRTQAIPPKRLAATLFGRDSARRPGDEMPGPGEVENAASGTLYIDDLSHVSLRCQAQLIELIDTGRYRRVGDLAQRQVHVRLMIGTTEPLEKLRQNRTILPELYHRLKGCALEVPALRNRPDDVALLADYFLRTLRKGGRTKANCVSPEAQRRLRSYGWPGNLRELASVIQQSVLDSRSSMIGEAHLPEILRATPLAPLMLKLPLGSRLVDIEREAILQTLRLTEGNKSQAATMLGMSRRSFYDRLQDYEKELGIDFGAEKRARKKAARRPVITDISAD